MKARLAAVREQKRMRMGMGMQVNVSGGEDRDWDEGVMG